MSQPNLTEDLNVIANSDLEITYMDGDLDIIQKLDDEPNDVGGLTSAELKAKFDEGSNKIKKFLNESLIPELLAADATEADRAEAEADRAEAEQERVAAETKRVSAENARATAEQTRTSAETAREGRESGRVSAEESRANAENKRETAEQSRAKSESDRQTAEIQRASAEQDRTAAEENRVSAENTRAFHEAARAQAEAARQGAEQERADAETARRAAETSRNVWEDYDSTKAYVPGNKVAWQGSSYVNISACTGITPTEKSDYWKLIARKGADGQGAGDMLASVYDPQNKAQDVFAYADQKIPASAKGKAGGVASLGTDGKVPMAQLPQFAAADHTHSAAAIGAAPSSHNHDASQITSGTLPVARGGTGQTTLTPAVATKGVRQIYAGTTDMTAGSSSLTTGCIYLVYE